MVTFHPEARFLHDYAAGSLPRAHAISVATHLAFCDKCRAHLQQLNSLGAALLERNDRPVELSKDAFSQVMARIEQGEPQGKSAPLAERSAGGHTDLPRVLTKLLGPDEQALQWRALGSKLRIANLTTGDQRREAALYHIRAGGRIPGHTHRGEEITVVLRGSFSDNEGCYRRGDFIVRTEGETHSPMATQNEDCLCLSVLEAPVVFTGLQRLINPFLRINAR